MGVLKSKHVIIMLQLAVKSMLTQLIRFCVMLSKYAFYINTFSVIYWELFFIYHEVIQVFNNIFQTIQTQLLASFTKNHCCIFMTFIMRTISLLSALTTCLYKHFIQIPNVMTFLENIHDTFNYMIYNIISLN